MTYAVLAVALLVAGWGIWVYNQLVRCRNQVNEAWAGIDVQLQRRYDLVPNLVAAVKGYLKHESSALARVTRLRGNPGLAVDARADQESGLSRSIGRLFAVAEAYPELKASEVLSGLHDSLVEIEEHLQYARRYYNGSVRDNNNRVENFPSLLIARAFGFRSAEFFEIEFASQRQAPAVRLEQP